MNPWLVQASSKGGQTKHEVAISKESAAAEKSKNKLRKRVKKRLEEKEKAQEDAAVDVSLSTVMTLTKGSEAGPSNAGQSSKPKSSTKASAAKGKARAPQADDDSDSDANSEVEEQESALARKSKGKANGVKAFEQRDLVALAFAGDNVVQVRYGPVLTIPFCSQSSITRTSPMQSGARSRKMRRRRSTQHFLDG